MTVVDQTRLAIDGGTPVRTRAAAGEQRQMGDDEIAALTEVIQLRPARTARRHEGERAGAGLCRALRSEARDRGLLGFRRGSHRDRHDQPGTGRRDHHDPVQRFRHDPRHPVSERDPGLRRSRSGDASVSTRRASKTNHRPDTRDPRGASLRRTRGCRRAPGDRRPPRYPADRGLRAGAAQRVPRAGWPGRSGEIGCFSLNNTKHLNCGEGGMVITNDDALARRARASSPTRPGRATKTIATVCSSARTTG